MSGASQHENAEPLKLPPLEEAILESHAFETDGIEAFLERLNRIRATEAGAWNGLAYTTAGAFPLVDFDETGSPILTGGDFSAGRVYELRVWLVPSEDCSVLARELRWLNGSGGADVIVRLPAAASKTTEHASGVSGSSSKRCWYRRNAYLQHVPSGSRALPNANDISEVPSMPSIEVFCEEEFGNVVFTDELMTGKWQYR